MRDHKLTVKAGETVERSAPLRAWSVRACSIDDVVRLDTDHGGLLLYVGQEVDMEETTNNFRLVNTGADDVVLHLQTAEKAVIGSKKNGADSGGGIDQVARDALGVLSSEVDKISPREIVMQISGRMNVSKNGAWYTSNSADGFNDEDFTSSAGSGAVPAINHGFNGVIVPVGYVVASVDIHGRPSNSDVGVMDMDVSIVRINIGAGAGNRITAGIESVCALVQTFVAGRFSKTSGVVDEHLPSSGDDMIFVSARSQDGAAMALDRSWYFNAVVTLQKQ